MESEQNAGGWEGKRRRSQEKGIGGTIMQQND